MPIGPGRSSSPSRSRRCTTSSTAWKRRCLGRWSAKPRCGWPKWSSGWRRGDAPLLRGYRTKIIDGNHLAATEHRIEELRTIGSGPLPGQALVVLEPDRMLVTDVFPCEDGHAQERSLLPQVLPTVEANDLWIADRNFCTTGFLFGIAGRDAAFLIRQHAQTLHYELLGDRRKIGRCPTGMIYEQKMRLMDEKGKFLGGASRHHRTEEADPRRRNRNPSVDEPACEGGQRPQRRRPLSPSLDGGKSVSRVGPGVARRDQDLGLSRGGVVEFLRGACWPTT